MDFLKWFRIQVWSGKQSAAYKQRLIQKLKGYSNNPESQSDLALGLRALLLEWAYGKGEKNQSAILRLWLLVPKSAKMSRRDFRDLCKHISPELLANPEVVHDCFCAVFTGH